MTSGESKKELEGEMAAAGTAEAPATDHPVDGDFEVLTKLMAENEELKDRALRAAAEMENLRRRTTRGASSGRSPPGSQPRPREGPPRARTIVGARLRRGPAGRAPARPGAVSHPCGRSLPQAPSTLR